MKIAVISDIHENLYNLISFYKEIKKQKVDYIFCLGDLINNGVAKILAFSGIPVKMVWGNNDGSKVMITKTSLSKKSLLKVSETIFDVFEIDGKRFFLTHYPILANIAAKSGDFDVVFFGHNHIYSNTKLGNCILANPGELSSHVTGKATYIIYDTEKNSIKIKKLKKFVNLKNKEVDEYRKKLGL